MNIQQLKCILEVESSGSISKAAEKLFMNQPNLSKMIMSIESEFGFALFQRTSNGVVPTREGEKFLLKAAELVTRADEFESEFKRSSDDRFVFRISLPRVSYLTHAFSQALAKNIPDGRQIQICCKETNNHETIDNVTNLGYDIGVIRFPVEFEQEYKKLLADKQLRFQEVMTFRFVVVMSKDHPLADAKNLHFSDLSQYIALVHGDNYSHLFSDQETDRYYRMDEYRNVINLFERGSQFDFLQNTPGTFMLVSPLPTAMLKKYGLVQVGLSEEDIGLFEDLLISRRNRRYSGFEQEFFHHLLNIEREIMGWE